jgi:hypothetical protein
VREVEVVVDLVESCLARRTVLEVERADARLDLVGRCDRRRDCARGLSGGAIPASENRRGEDCRRQRELTMDSFHGDHPQGAICYDGRRAQGSPEKMISRRERCR